MLSGALTDLTPEQIAELVRKLDNVCTQAKELSDQLKGAMIGRARRDQQMLSALRKPDPPLKVRKRR